MGVCRSVSNASDRAPAFECDKSSSEAHLVVHQVLKNSRGCKPAFAGFRPKVRTLPIDTMMSSFFLHSLSAVVLVLLSRVISFAQVSKDSVWIQDPNGCKVYNPNPVKDETISWSGTCANGYATGSGTLVWFKKGKQNQKYVGEMHRGKPHGQGKYLYASGSTREGTYRNGDLYGHAQIIDLFDNGKIMSVYSGQVVADDRSGFGRQIEFMESGDTLFLYTGDFFEDEMHGKGLLKSFDDNVILITEGEFKRGETSGKVTERQYTDGQLTWLYRGEISGNVRNGYGEEVRGLTKYAGNWEQSLRAGQGKLYLDTMLIYDGQWKLDKFNGIGKRYFFDGSSYAGEFKDNSRHGIGAQYWPNGTSYIGEFRKDLYSGTGYFLKKGTAYKSGKWENGVLVSAIDSSRVVELLITKYKDKLTEIKINLAP